MNDRQTQQLPIPRVGEANYDESANRHFAATAVERPLIHVQLMFN